MAVPITTDAERLSRFEGSLVVDALIGYGLSGEVRSPANNYTDSMNTQMDPIVSLDVPSGMDATTGETHEIAIRPDRTVTLALPKTGLGAVAGTLYLADIGIPNTVYERLDIEYEAPFGDRDWIELRR